MPARSHTQLQCEPVGSEVQSVKLSIAGFRLSHPEAEIAWVNVDRSISATRMQSLESKVENSDQSRTQTAIPPSCEKNKCTACIYRLMSIGNIYIYQAWQDGVLTCLHIILWENHL